MATRAEVEAYYRAVAPFYAADVADRGDLTAWVALARECGATRALDVGTGGGRVASALALDDPSRRVVGVDLTAALVGGPLDIAFVLGDVRALPFADATFDLVCAANDPLAHLLRDGDRVAALREMRRVLRPGGRAVVDGLRLSASDRARAESGLVRTRTRAGVRIRETWTASGGATYDVTYEYATAATPPVRASTRLREWVPGEPALAHASLRGGLDGRAFDPRAEHVAIAVG